jgi:hypothetical protein
MLTDGRFWAGVVTGLVGLYVYHHFISAVPGGKSS